MRSSGPASPHSGQMPASTSVCCWRICTTWPPFAAGPRGGYLGREKDKEKEKDKDKDKDKDKTEDRRTAGKRREKECVEGGAVYRGAAGGAPPLRLHLHPHLRLPPHHRQRQRTLPGLSRPSLSQVKREDLPRESRPPSSSSFAGPPQPPQPSAISGAGGLRPAQDPAAA